MGKESGWKDCPYRESTKSCRFGTPVCATELPTERHERMQAIDELVQRCLRTYVLGHTLDGVGTPHRFIQEET